MNMTLKVFVVCFSGKSGLTDYTVSLCQQLSKLCNLEMITSSVYERSQYKASFSIHQLFRRTRFYPIDIIRFAFYIIKQKPDVVLFQSWLKLPFIEWFVIRLFKLFNIKTALTVHDLLPHYPKPWSQLILSRFYACFDKLIVHSAKSAAGLKDMGVDTIPLIVPHGVYDIFNIDSLVRDDVSHQFPQIESEDFVVLYFGYMDTRKGIFEYLAASELLQKHQNVKFLVSGASSLNTQEEEKLEFYKNKVNVILYDQLIPMEEVQHYFTIADVVALPYLEGTTSGILKMAIAFNKPVIATDIGDFAETLEEWPGMLIPSSNIAQNLAEAVIAMQERYSDYLQDVGGIKGKYQWDSIADKHIEYLTV